MVATTTAYLDSRNRAATGQGYDGVVRVSVAGYYGTGTLLYGGQAVLTAAHLFDHAGLSASVSFETASGTQLLASRAVLLHPDYDDNDNNDLALVWLSQPAPLAAQRYQLYRDTDELGQAFQLVGYGVPGTGAAGVDMAYGGAPLRLQAANRFDADSGLLARELGSWLTWKPLAGSQLLADFDDGSQARDALGRLLYRADLGRGSAEGLITPGDSGGPAFVAGRLAGVASYVTSLGGYGVEPDINAAEDSSVGEVAAWQRVSFYQQWLDQSLRARYADAPTQPAEVRKSVSEGSSGGTSYAYFLLQFTGARTDPAQVLSVDYATRDGSARAGQDYLAASGTLKLYPGEVQAVIPVEVIGDATSEPDETFYLDVTHPVGGSLGAGVVQLTAVRTIVDDDGGWG